MSRVWRVRPETAGDVDAVRAVHVAAFPSIVESRLVDAMRAADKAVISLVADDGQDIIDGLRDGVGARDLSTGIQSRGVVGARDSRRKLRSALRPAVATAVVIGRSVPS